MMTLQDMTLPQLYDSMPRAEYPKTELVNKIYEGLLWHEQTNEEWLEIELKAPTRDTVMNWCTGKTKPTNPLYLRALSKILNKPIDKLF